MILHVSAQLTISLRRKILISLFHLWSEFFPAKRDPEALLEVFATCGLSRSKQAVWQPLAISSLRG